MNIYKVLNEMSEYIENNLENEIDYKKLAQIMLVNSNTMQRVFSIVCDISLSDYIRKRRLSKAGVDIYNGKMNILEVAQKYQYESSTAFSRAFEKFHGIKPSMVKENVNTLKVFPKLYFDKNSLEEDNIEYSIVNKEELILYGICKKTNQEIIQKEAPEHFAKVLKKYGDKFGMPNFGMTVYEDYTKRIRASEYWVLYEKEINLPEFEKVIIPKCTWLSFKINSQEVKDIQYVTNRFYKKILKSIDYKLNRLPELEHYHDDITELLIPIK